VRCENPPRDPAGRGHGGYGGNGQTRRCRGTETRRGTRVRRASRSDAHCRIGSKTRNASDISGVRVFDPIRQCQPACYAGRPVEPRLWASVSSFLRVWPLTPSALLSRACYTEVKTALPIVCLFGARRL